MHVLSFRGIYRDISLADHVGVYTANTASISPSINIGRKSLGGGSRRAYGQTEARRCNSGGRRARGSTKARDKLSPGFVRRDPGRGTREPARSCRAATHGAKGCWIPPRFRCAVRALREWREKGFLSGAQEFRGDSVAATRRAVASAESLFFSDEGGGRGITQ